MLKIPSTKQLYDTINEDISTKLDLSDDELKKTVNALSSVLAGQFRLSYLALKDNLDNALPDTADISENGGTLDRLGRIYLNRNQKPATTGRFNILVTATAGSTLRANLTFKSNEGSLNPGEIYILENEVVLAGGGDLVEIRSIGAGTDFDLRINDTLVINEPVIGVSEIVSINSIVEQPLSSESNENFRKAQVDSIQLEPQGGAKTDYRLWSQDAQGVRLVYPFVQQLNAGTVDIFVEATKEDSIDGEGTPSAALLLLVEQVIELDPDNTKPIYERGRRPMQSIINAQPVLINPVDVTITGLTIQTPQVEDAIRLNIQEFLKDVRPFIAGGDLARNKNDILYSGRLNSAIINSLESTNFFDNMEMFVNGNLQVSYLFSNENIPYLRNLIFE